MTEPSFEKALQLAKIGALFDQTEFTPDEVMDIFAATIYNLPENAMRWSLAHWDQVAPVFVEWLRNAASLPAPNDGFDNTGLFITLLCAQMRETRAFPLLCELMHRDEAVQNMLGDAAFELLGSILVATFDGDTAPLTAVVTNVQGDEYIRSSALGALACLAAEGTIPRADVHKLLVETHDELFDEDFYAFQWANTVACLDFADLVEKAEKLYVENRLQSFATLKQFKDDLEQTRANPGLENVPNQMGFRPFADTIEELSKWASFDGRGEREDGEMEDADFADDALPGGQPASYFDRGSSETVTNPYKNVGRNDPCPCGSGKKFKKCCAD